ncbi:hypothetical protein [Amycolatopsis thermoflava]|uniref:Uncharacterized protein n=1 Tax=Amycolatopsis thermoflava TaxID=84480 RepID=A0A3N2GSK5_9PSEU|nr:hypothetical protein [Amycolatopsis thermoflava]ROS39641.1 hypothetical protein EDD35_1951 [Amycolatopsis thermoflava]
MQTTRHTRTPDAAAPVLFSHPLVEEPARTAGEVDVTPARHVRFAAPTSAPARRR